MKVRKKLGTLVDYDSSKVFQVVLNAIEDARAAEGKKFDQRYDTVIASHVTDTVDDEVSSTDDWIDHRELQDIIYKCLIDAYEVIAAREYLHYSDKKNQWHEDSNDVEEAVKQVIGGDPNVVNENGNKDSRQLVTQRDLIAGQVFRTVGLKMYPEDIQEAHEEGLIHIHDTDYSTLLPYTNCCVVNIEDMLNNGFHMGETLITKPHTIGVATALVAEILNAVSMSQFGGTTAPDIDVVLAPFAKMNYDKYLADAEKFNIPNAEHYAHDMTKHDIYEAMQGLEYNINSMHANAGQVPFTAISIGQSTDWFGREIQKAVLNVRIKGLNGKTAIFPKISLIIDDGVNLKPTDPNYDIKQLGLKCSSLRDYPDLIMAKNNRKMNGGTKVISPMGCVSGEELVTVKDNDDRKHTIPIGRLYDSYYNDEKVQPNGVDTYIDLEGIQIKDSHTGESKFVDCLRVIKNSNNKWLRLKFSNGRVLECTTDHPLEVIGKGRVYAEDLVAGDEIKIADDIDNGTQEAPFNDDYAWLLGDLICDGCIDSHSESIISYAYKGEEEIRESIGKVYANSPEMLRDWEHHRGKKGDYREVAIKDPALHDYAVKCFRGKNKDTRSLPDFIYTTPKHTRLAFMAGMIDADGYLNQHSQRIQIGSTSKALANGQMLLAESLGVHASMIINHYNSKGGVRYRVEFRIPNDLVGYIKCAKKRNKYNPGKGEKRPNTRLRLIDAESIDGYPYSYDVTTASDYFDVSGMVSHNCRSYLPAWVNPVTGEEQTSGRQNLGVATLNLPRVALDSHGDKTRFWELFKERVELVHKALQVRIKQAERATPESAPILYMEGAIGRLKAGDDVRVLWKGGRASVSFGFIGIYEMNTVFYGSEWETNEEAKQFSIEVLNYISKKCKQWYKEEDYYYSLYATPSESLTDKFCRMDTITYGKVKNITDKEYYVNSFH